MFRILGEESSLNRRIATPSATGYRIQDTEIQSMLSDRRRILLL